MNTPGSVVVACIVCVCVCQSVRPQAGQSGLNFEIRGRGVELSLSQSLRILDGRDFRDSRHGHGHGQCHST